MEPKTASLLGTPIHDGSSISSSNVIIVSSSFTINNKTITYAILLILLVPPLPLRRRKGVLLLVSILYEYSFRWLWKRLRKCDNFKQTTTALMLLLITMSYQHTLQALFMQIQGHTYYPQDVFVVAPAI